MDFHQTSALIFVIILSILLYKNKEKVQIQKVIGWFLWVGMYRTSVGIKAMDNIAKKHPRLLQWYATWGIYIGFLGMILIVGNLVWLLIKTIMIREAIPGVGIVQPFVPGVKGTFYVPFFYFIICLFFIIGTHEFMHGVISRLYKFKIKSSGLACMGILLPIIPMAFVEPDEKALKKADKKKQMGVYAAGPMANILTAAFVILAMFLLSPAYNSMVQVDGMGINDYIRPNNQTYPAEAAGIAKGELITQINDFKLTQLNGDEADKISEYLSTLKPGDTVNLVTNVTSYSIVLNQNPKDPTKGMIGIVPTIETSVTEIAKEKYGMLIPVLEYILALLVWLFILSLGIGLINLAPLGPVDGGRMFYCLLLYFMPKKKAEKVWTYVSMTVLGILVLNIVISIFA